MKFLCPSCKAKYQIGDEKVAGRSVRMKCRKCGYVIQVSSVPGLGDALPGSEPPPPDSASDVSGNAAAVDVLPADVVPSAPPPSAGTPRPAPAAKSAPSAASAPASTRSPSTAQRPEVKKIPVATGPRAAVPKPAAVPSAPKAPVPAAPKPPTPAPKSSPQKPAVAAPAPSPKPAPVGGGLGVKPDKPAAPSATSTPAVAAKPAIVEKYQPPSVVSFADVDEDERTRIASGGALAGAFSLAVGSQGDSGPDSLSMPADEWFVGINGVPVGPIRLSELRSKAAAGSVNRESLVWRDGFEDWRPLKTYPELVAIVEEGVSSARASLTPFTPAASEVGNRVGAGLALGAADVAASPSAVTGSAVVTDDIAALVPPRRGTSPLVWVAMV